MNLQSLVVVLLRLASLDFLLQFCIQMVLKLTSLSSAYHDLPAGEFRSTMITPLLVCVGLIVGAVFLWVWSMPIARFITRGLPAELSLGALTLADCYALVFVGLGLFYVVGYFAPVLNWTHYLLKMEASRPDDSWRQQMNWYDVSRSFLTFIAAIVLIVNGRKWGLALAGKQSTSITESTPPNPEQRTAE